MSPGDIAAIHSMYQLWHYNVPVLRTYATYHSRNVWALFGGLGWRRIKAYAKDGDTNTFIACCKAVANQRRMHVLVDGSTLFRVQLV